MRIPSSYLPTGPDDGSAIYQDGKVGVAYIQEYRFAKYVERLQKQIEEDLDREFKLFVKFRGIEIPADQYSIEFNKPMNFSSYRDLQIETERAQLFNQLAQVPYMSNQFKMKKYLNLSDEEMVENEALWRQENNVDKYQGAQEDGIPGLSNIGVRPDPNVNVDPEVEPDLSGIEPPEGGDPTAGDPTALDALATPTPGGEPGQV